MSPLKDLDNKLKAARGRHQKVSGSTSGSGMAMAFRVGIEFVSAIGVGVVIGLLLDDWLLTKPWFMIAFFLIGSAAGFLNIFRTMNGFGYASGYDAKAEEKNPQNPDKE